MLACRQTISFAIRRNSNLARTSKKQDPTILLRKDLEKAYSNGMDRFCKGTNQPELSQIATYYFDYIPKGAREITLPMMLARAINRKENEEVALEKQLKVALYFYITVSATLLHDDLLDNEKIRRNKPSANNLWSWQKVTSAGNYNVAKAVEILSELDVEVA